MSALSRVTEPSDKLLDLTYDAATDEELWTSALIQIAGMTASFGLYAFYSAPGLVTPRVVIASPRWVRR
jgi:hypothetical protein